MANKENNQIEAAQIIYDGLLELGEQIKDSGPNAYSSMSGNSLTDSMMFIGLQLERIADVMVKESKK
jgi:hypothetical protein